MRMQTIFVLCCVSLMGCNGSTDKPNTSDSKEVQQGADDLESALSEISIGTSESDLMAIMTRHSLDSGTVYLGGSGARRIYFGIADDKQIWFELSGPLDGNGVTTIGPIEPKSNWTRHDGDSITVA